MTARAVGRRGVCVYHELQGWGLTVACTSKTGHPQSGPKITPNFTPDITPNSTPDFTPNSTPKIPPGLDCF